MATDWIHIDDAHDIVSKLRHEKDDMINAQREMITAQQDHIAVLHKTVQFWQSKYETLLAQYEEISQ